jgi:hypothetical protein
MSLAFLIPSTSKGKEWTSFEDTFLNKILLKSFLKTASNKFDYTFYLGFDKEDNLFNDKSFVKELDNFFIGKKIKYHIVYFSQIRSGQLTKMWNIFFSMRRRYRIPNKKLG